MKNHLRIGSLFGVPLRIDLTWLLIFAYATWSLATTYAPAQLPDAATGVHWLVGAGTSLLFFTSVVLHELGHALVSRAQGHPVKQITLFIFGGAAEITTEPDTPGKELALALAGPGVSLLLSGLFLLVSVAAAAVPWLRIMATYLAGVNLVLAVFNLIPGFPLDGGRVFRALVWWRSGDLAMATRWAVRVGRFIAYGLMALGFWLVFRGQFGDGLWLLLIGMFLDGSARSAGVRANLDQVFEGHTVAEVMTRDCPTAPPQLTLDVFVEHYLLRQGRRCYIVGDAGSPQGMLTVHNVQEVPRDRWPDTHVGDVAKPLTELRTVTPETPLMEALTQMTAEGVNQLPVLVDGVLAGMITREGLVTFMRTRSELGVTGE